MLGRLFGLAPQPQPQRPGRSPAEEARGTLSTHYSLQAANTTVALERSVAFGANRIRNHVRHTYTSRPTLDDHVSTLLSARGFRYIYMDGKKLSFVKRKTNRAIGNKFLEEGLVTISEYSCYTT